MLNLFDSAIYLMERGAFINEPIQVGEQMEPVYFYLMKNNPSLVFSPVFSTLIERADLKLIKQFRLDLKLQTVLEDSAIICAILVESNINSI